MVFPPCPLNFIRDQKGSGFKLNAVPIQQIGAVYRLYFPRPFLLVGMCPLDQLPLSDPGWFESYANLTTAGEHNIYSDLFGSLFIDLAFANCETYEPLLRPVNYVGPGVQATDYRGYFTKFLNDPAIAERAQNYNSFIQPHSVVKKFFNHNALTAQDIWLQRWYEMLQFLQLTSDVKLWGAPGEYNIATAAVDFFNYPQWQPEQGYQILHNV